MLFPKSYGNTGTQITEAGESGSDGGSPTIIWTNGAFVPGVAGIESGSDDGGDYITFVVTSGSFVFATTNAATVRD